MDILTWSREKYDVTTRWYHCLSLFAPILQIVRVPSVTLTVWVETVLVWRDDVWEIYCWGSKDIDIIWITGTFFDFFFFLLNSAISATLFFFIFIFFCRSIILHILSKTMPKQIILLISAWLIKIVVVSVATVVAVVVRSSVLHQKFPFRSQFIVIWLLFLICSAGNWYFH